MSSFNTQHIQSAANPLVFFLPSSRWMWISLALKTLQNFTRKIRRKERQKKKIVVLALNSWRLTFIHDPIANDYRYKREQVKKLKKKRLSILSIYPRVSLFQWERKCSSRNQKKKKRKMKIPSGRTTDNKQNILLQGWWFFKSLQISSKKSCPCSLLTRRKRRIISFKQK